MRKKGKETRTTRYISTDGATTTTLGSRNPRVFLVSPRELAKLARDRPLSLPTDSRTRRLTRFLPASLLFLPPAFPSSSRTCCLRYSRLAINFVRGRTANTIQPLSRGFGVLVICKINTPYADAVKCVNSTLSACNIDLALDQWRGMSTMRPTECVSLPLEGTSVRESHTAGRNSVTVKLAKFPFASRRESGSRSNLSRESAKVTTSPADYQRLG